MGRAAKDRSSTGEAVRDQAHPEARASLRLRLVPLLDAVLRGLQGVIDLRERRRRRRWR